MVVISGYTVPEFFLIIGMTYALITLFAILLVMSEILRQEYGNSPKMGRKVAFIVMAYAVMSVLYMFDLRIGTVMFFNGMFTAFIAAQVIEILKAWNPLKRVSGAAEDAAKKLAGVGNGPEV